MPASSTSPRRLWLTLAGPQPVVSCLLFLALLIHQRPLHAQSFVNTTNGFGQPLSVFTGTYTSSNIWNRGGALEWDPSWALTVPRLSARLSLQLVQCPSYFCRRILQKRPSLMAEASK